VVLSISRDTERVLRQRAPDFVTWAAQSYALPGPEELAALARQLGVSSGSVRPAAPEEEPIRFLHLSDVHLRPDRVKRYDQDRVLRGLLDLLERDRGSFPLDAVFFTGDLAHAGKAEEYALAVDLLRKLLEVTGVPPERLFVVPGNHDVDRGVGRWLTRTLAKDEDAIAFFTEEGSRKFHVQKRGAYQKSLTELLGTGRPLGLRVGAGAVETFDVRGARLAVASFNSAWFAQDDYDHGKLWLGEANVDGAARRIADEGASFAIALLHHPFDYLHDIERDAVEQRFERTFDLMLRGHLHRDKTRSIVSQRGGFVEVASPAAYQGSQWPNGCFFGEIRPLARTVRLRPYAYVSGADPWVLDTKVFPDDAEEGYCHTFAVPEKRRTRGTLAARLAEATKSAVRTGGSGNVRAVAAELGMPTPAGELPREFVEQVAKAAAARSDDVSLLERTLSADQVAQAVVEDVAQAQAGVDRISRKEPGFLERALLYAAQMVDRVLSTETLPRDGRINLAAPLLRIALSTIVEGPVEFEPLLRLGKRQFRPDILIGRHDDPADQRAIIEVVSRHHPAVRNGALHQLDGLLDASGAGHGAVVVLHLLPSGEQGPQLEHVKTPAGRDALLLHL